MQQRNAAGGGSAGRLGRRVERLAARASSKLSTMLALDAARTGLAYVVVLVLRFDGAVPAPHWTRFGLFLPVAILIHLVVNRACKLYGQVWRHASIDEALRVARAGALSLLPLLVYDTIITPRVPLSVVVLGAMVSTLLTGVARFQARLLSALSQRRTHAPTTPVVLIGSDDTAARLIQALRSETGPGVLTPVSVLTDGTNDRGLSLLGVRVEGAIEDLPRVARERNVAYALLAMTNPSREVFRRAADAAEIAGLPLKVLPDVRQALRVGASVARTARDVRIEDLLGREEVSTDLAAVRKTVQGRRVLVTGAGGSIGSEIARQIALLSPASVLMLDHDETHLFEAAAAVEGASAVQLLADIRDRDVLMDVFARHRPEVVFHAAAHKHVPLLEEHPCEAVRTNVLGTRNVLDAATEVGAAILVSISTDKAVDPLSIMGASKWWSERLVARHTPPGARWCSVRFGNVLGSRGSVIPVFTRQIENGGPVTVTDDRMTRYFMSTKEAVQLVLQAATYAEGSETFMLEMGEPVNILDLAKKMIRLAGHLPGADIAIEITGARPGEKVMEKLSTSAEIVNPTDHEAIRCLIGPSIDRIELDRLLVKLEEVATSGDETTAADLLRELPSRALGADRETGRWDRTST